jgi:Methylamine utilisation protein MauE
MREPVICERSNSYSDTYFGTEALNPARIADMSATTTANFSDRGLELPAWKNIVGHIAALSVAIIFLATGIAKMAVPYQVQTMFEQLLVPAWASLPLVIVLAIGEALGGLLVLMPRYRRWGAWLIAAMLVAFMGYIGLRYQALVGRDCSCFPWLKRAVTPALFVEDGAMLAAALIAAWFSRKPSSLRFPIIALVAISVLAGAGLGYNTMHQSGIQVPETILVDGKPFNIRQGHILLFFYDPHCSHCEEAAQHMSTYGWKKDVTVIGLPTVDPQLADSFLDYTKLVAKTSTDSALLRKLFVFTSPPYGVVLDGGRVKSILTHFDAPEPQPSLQQAGFID